MPPGPDTDLLDRLRSANANVREEALSSLPSVNDGVGAEILRLMEADPNDNVRRAAIEALGQHGVNTAVPDLVALAADREQPTFLRRAAVVSLGAIRAADAVPTFGAILSSKSEDRGLVHECMSALMRIGGEAAARCLLGELGIKNDRLRGRIARELGELGPGLNDTLGDEVVDQLKKRATSDSAANVRRACLNAIASFGPSASSEFLAERLRDEQDGKNRLRCVELLGEAGDDRAVTTLSNFLITERRAETRAASRDALRKIQGWRPKADAILDAIDRSNAHRGDISAPHVVQAILGAGEAELNAGTALTDHLIEHALGAPERVVAVLASLIIASSGSSVVEAGSRLNRYAEGKELPEEQMQGLRIEIGGQAALDPILEELKTNLELYFQKPLLDLNTLTKNDWTGTIRYVRWGFIARLLMSVCVFLVGLGITVWSVFRIMQGTETSNVWGPGVTFIGGLGSMLAIVYAGPLKDIQQSVRDLATSSAAFIGFVHRVLQVSHTFSAAYLKGKISFEQTAKANELIDESVGAMTKLLRETKADDTANTDADDTAQ